MRTLMQMPKPEIRMPKECRNLKPEAACKPPGPVSSFALRASFGFRHPAFGIPLLLLSTLIPPLSTLGQPYAINWHTIDGGGGTSTGGVYSVSGTIGQPDAGGPMTGGGYSVTGGFWALPSAVQTEGAPTLTITKGVPGFATVSWTPASTNWVLQERLSLASGSWSNSPSGVTNPVVVPATLPTKFYRLFRP